MEAVILAGGFGTRLKDVVKDLPKPMAPISGRPFLEILLSNLSRNGFKRVVLSLGFMNEVIVNHFGSSFLNLDLDYVIEDRPLGTGGATRLAMRKVIGDHVFVMNGDTFTDLNFSALEQNWKKRKVPFLVCKKVEDASRYGRVLIEDQRVVGFSEKGASGPGLISLGCYVLPKAELDIFDENRNFSLESDYFELVVKRKEIISFQTDGMFIDIGVPEDYYKAQSELLRYLP